MTATAFSAAAQPDADPPPAASPPPAPSPPAPSPAAEPEPPAEDGSNDERARAVELGRMGVELYNQQRWVDAFERFEKAHALVHSPVFVLYMARAKRQLGELLDAAELYQQVITDPLPADAPAPWSQARADAEEERNALVATIPRIAIVVEPVTAPGLGSGPVRVWLDDRELGEARKMPLDPGAHVVRAQCGDGQMRTKKVEAKLGEEAEVWLDPRCGKRGRPSPSPDEPPRRSGKTQRYVGIGLVITAAIPLAIAVVTGPLTVALAGDLEDTCNEDLVCPESEEVKVGTYDALAHTTTATLIIGGVLAAAGIITWASAPSAADTVSLTRDGVLFRF